MGRIIEDKNTVSTTTFQSRAYGKRENKVINITGRVQFDLLHILLRDYKLRSYTLNSVSYHFLQEQKEDVPHTIISDLQVSLIKCFLRDGSMGGGGGGGGSFIALLLRRSLVKCIVTKGRLFNT